MNFKLSRIKQDRDVNKERRERQAQARKDHFGKPQLDAKGRPMLSFWVERSPEARAEDAKRQAQLDAEA